MKVKQAYKLYYKMKTSYLESTLTESLVDDDEEPINSSQMDYSVIASTSVQELLSCESFSNLPDSSFSNISTLRQAGEFPESVQPQIEKNSVKVFEAALESTVNDDAWGENLNKKNVPKKTLTERVPSKLKLNLSNVDLKSFLKNPRKSLSRHSSKSDQISSNELCPREVLPELETILLEKSRSNKTVAKIPSTTIAHHVDIGWLDRNTPLEDSKLIQNSTPISTSSFGSFGLSNLNMQSSSFIASVNKYHTLDGATDDEVIGNSDEESTMPAIHLHIAKKRKISCVLEPPPLRIESVAEVAPITVSIPKVVPQKSSRNRSKTEYENSNSDFDCDDSDKDPDFVEEKIEPIKSPELPILKVKKPKDSKKTKKVVKHLTKTRGAKKRVSLVNHDNKSSEETETLESILDTREYDNFLIDSDLSHIKSVPRITNKELEKNDKIFNNYIKSLPPSKTTANSGSPAVVRDVKTGMNKEKLEKRVAAGTLNENFVRVNLKKKIFVRGKKSFNFSSYKKKLWKVSFNYKLENTWN